MALQVTYAFLVFLQLLFGNHAGLAAKDNENTIKMDALTLVKADNKPIESLDALSSGVYSIGLAQGVRPGCGGSGSSDQGMYEPLFDFIHIVLFIIYMYFL
jgi:hypothetical protein